MWTFFWAGSACQFLLFGLVKARRQITARTRWARTTGTIVDSRFSGLNPELVIRFTTRSEHGGQMIQHSPRSTTMVGSFMVGRTVTLWYKPADPMIFEADTWWGSKLNAAGQLALAGICVYMLIRTLS